MILSEAIWGKVVALQPCRLQLILQRIGQGSFTLFTQGIVGIIVQQEQIEQIGLCETKLTSLIKLLNELLAINNTTLIIDVGARGLLVDGMHVTPFHCQLKTVDSICFSS